MARITVEDCLDKVENRFILVLLSAKRARQIQLGASEPLVDLDNDKPTVIALREIAQDLVSEKNIDILTRHADDRINVDVEVNVIDMDSDDESTIE